MARTHGPVGAALRIFVRAVFGWIRERVRARVGPLAVHEVHPGAVTFVQRFGDALDLNPHFTRWCSMARTWYAATGSSSFGSIRRATGTSCA
ncbi:MAG TPA: hypothetical protein VG755_24770 [Nannocystaceae bacterium]|nr:hypothetical protein [Nannocystaceae bacterium]